MTLDTWLCTSCLGPLNKKGSGNCEICGAPKPAEVRAAERMEDAMRGRNLGIGTEICDGQLWQCGIDELVATVEAARPHVIVCLAAPDDFRAGEEWCHNRSDFYIRWSFPDTNKALPPLGDLELLAHTINLHLDAGRRVLVHCAAGYNRSSLVVAKVLMRRGLTATQAINLIRKVRKPALSNELFVQYLKHGVTP